MARPLRYIVCAIASVAIVAASGGVAGGSRTGGVTAPTGRSSATAFDGSGMWIWYVNQSNGGSIPGIIARARAHKIRTVFVKSGDGTTYWQQFSQVVRPLQAGGLHVCGWQYVYGRRPGDEANVAAQAIKAGAACFVIDAEAEYENNYRAAIKYVHKLRRKAGAHYPIGLA